MTLRGPEQRSQLRRGSNGSEVERLQRLLTILGDYDHRIDGAFGPATDAAVRSFQRRNGLVSDGIVGPRTWACLEDVMMDGEEPLRQLRHAWRERDAADLDVDPPAGAPVQTGASPSSEATGAPHDAERARMILRRAEEEWRRPVAEPQGPGWERIDEYIRGPHGLQWTWEERYVRNRQFAWCGAFAAYCYQAPGLKADIRKSVMPSTYRLFTWARGTPRALPLDAAEPGDIVLVGPEGGRRWGAHITICESLDDGGRLATWEGNAHGAAPDGNRHEGVVRHRRPMPGADLPPRTYRVMHVIRPLPEDFD